MRPPLIQIKDLGKSFDDNRVLNGVNLSIFEGEITSIIGKSGVGKSVLLKHIIGLISPDSGEILFEGRPLQAMTKDERRALKRKFSYMFQGSALFDSLTVFDNIALPLKEKTRLSQEQIRQRVSDKMAQLDLRGIEQDHPSQLSGGMKKRVALARALITEPTIVLFDEPTTGLDPIRKNVVHSMISEYQARFGFTGVIVSHEIPDIFFISQRIAMLEEGHILFEGSPDEIQSSRDETVQQFIQGLEKHYDELTGLPSHLAGAQSYKKEMARLYNHAIAFSLILITVQNLEQINQDLGHAVGQTALKNFALQLQRNIRITDTCSRYGLNKILLVLANTDKNQAVTFCDNLAHRIKGTQILDSISEPGFCLSVRAGIVEAQKGSQIEDVLIEAEGNHARTYEFRIC